MILFAPGIALLKPMRGTLRFWVLPAPLLLCLGYLLLSPWLEWPAGAEVISALVLLSLLAWWYLQLCFFRITRSERDRT